ncbi:uncharacterized protein [Watersipora subatra]|uniref:uncharacterized protein n=1 Tax=Watersipora subatra TaxID=2589382 RepID=UPI00355C9E5A
MLEAANELSDDFKDKDMTIKRIKNKHVSEGIVHDRAIIMENQVEKQQMNYINAAKYSSLAFDISTDISHSSQFSIIARYIAGDKLCQKSLAVLSLKGTTRGEDLFKSFMKFAEKKSTNEKTHFCKYRWCSLHSEKKQRIINTSSGAREQTILSIHCILHKEALCAQTCDNQPDEVMPLIIRMVKFIVAKL